MQKQIHRVQVRRNTILRKDRAKRIQPNYEVINFTIKNSFFQASICQRLQIPQRLQQLQLFEYLTCFRKPTSGNNRVDVAFRSAYSKTFLRRAEEVSNAFRKRPF